MKWFAVGNRVKTAIGFILLVALIYVQQKRWSDDHYKATINSDGRGYYAYLPACFIYHDLQFKFIPGVEKEIFGTGAGNYINGPTGKEYNKYFVGVAILESPFFFAACLVEKLRGVPITGYSKIFQYAISISTLFYLGLGLFFLGKLLDSYKITENNKVIVLLALVFGTNLFYYATMEPGMSHVYSFTLIAAFCWRSRRFFETENFKDLLGLCFLLAFIVLIRPMNILVILSWPFLFGGFRFIKPFLKHFEPKKILLIIGVAGGLLLLQVIIYYLEVRQLWIWSYQDERFYFNKPHMISILFGFRKGFFVYTPLIGLSFITLFINYKAQLWRIYSFVLFFLILTYMLSCWWSWWYGGSFGLRAYIDFYPVLILPLGLALQSISKFWNRILLISATSVCTIVSIIQTEQYNAYILHMEYMNMDRYWKIFLSLDPSLKGIFYRDDYLLEQERQLAKVHFEGDKVVYSTINNFNEENLPNWENNGEITNMFGIVSQRACEVSTIHPFSSTYVNKIDSLKKMGSNGYLRISASVFTKIMDTDASIVVSLEDGSGSYNYQRIFIKPRMKAKVWKDISYNLKFGEAKKAGDLIKIYFFSTKGEFYVTNFKVELIE